MEARIEILRIVFGLVRFWEEEDRAVKHELGKRVMLQMDRIELGELKGFCDSVFVLWWKKRVNDKVRVRKRMVMMMEIVAMRGLEILLRLLL